MPRPSAMDTLGRWSAAALLAVAERIRFRSVYRIEAPDSEGVTDHARIMCSWLWGAFGTDLQGIADEARGQPLAMVAVESNLLFDLISVLTLGLASPKLMRWKIAEPRSMPARVHQGAPAPPPGPPPVFHDTTVRRWRDPNPHMIERKVGGMVNVWNGRPLEPTVDGYNAVTRGFQVELGRALEDGYAVRAMGAGWSYSRVLETEGKLFNTRPLTYTFEVAADQTHPDFEGAAGRLLFCQCGTTVNDINRILTGRNQSLPTTGAGDRQTIAGAISTGTHGSALDVGSMQDYVVALHLIVSPERSVWLERASRPVASDAYARAFGVEPSEVLRDDELFDAAVLSFGCFGILHGVMVEARGALNLRASRQRIPLDEGVWKAIETLDFSGAQLPLPDKRPFHFALVIDTNAPESDVDATVMYEADTPPPGAEPSSKESTIGETTLELIGNIMALAPGVTKPFQAFLLRTLYAPYDNVYDSHAEIFDIVTARGKGLSVGLAMPPGRARDALDILTEEVRDYPAPVLVQIRLIPPSRATLAFARFKPHTCIFEIDGPDIKRVRRTLKTALDRFEAAEIPFACHWGKVNDPSPSRVLRGFEAKDVERWRTARERLLPTVELRRLFSNAWVEAIGLGDKHT
ncbi:MAG: FAD-binding protein [Myxococcota bacterium]